MYQLLASNSTKGQFTRFLLIGGFTTLLNYAIFAVLFFLGVNYLFASASGYITGFFIGFVLFRKYTFRSQGSWKKQLTLQIAVYGFSLLLNLFTLWMLATLLLVNPLIANIVAIGVSTVTNFLGMKFIVFAN